MISKKVLLEKTKIVTLQLKLDKKVLNELVKVISKQPSLRDKKQAILNIDIPVKTRGTPL